MDSLNPVKRILTPLITLLLLCLLAACGPVLSIHPLYTDKDVVFDPALIGTWVDPTDSSNAPVVFERGSDNSYRVITQLDKSNVDQIFEAHLVKLNGRLFLDAVQTKNRIAGQEEDIGIAVPGHVFARVSIEDDSLRLDLLDQDWIKDQLAVGKISIAHEEVEGDVVLTASPSEVQRFILEHANEKGAFEESEPLQRKK